MARASDAHGIGFRNAMPDPFALPPAEATPLAARIAGRIRREGPIRFAAFMEAALYDPELGYYRSGRPTVGREGDFLTSPEVHPIFGYALGRLAAALWEALGQPASFTVRDVGPGSGALLESLFAWADSGRGGAGFAAALRGELVEPSAAAAERQRRRLGHWGARLRWQERPEASEPVRGLVIGNELLDAQPVQRLRWSGSAWEELYVDVAAGRFVEVRRAIQEAAVLRPLAGVAAREGQVVEVCPSLAALSGRLAATVGHGLLLLCDYGAPRAQLYAPWRRGGTLLTFHRHSAGEDPYTRVGEQDLSCHVDVETVQEAALAAGLRAYPPRSQAEFLASLGATRAAAAEGERGAELEATLARRRAVETLTDPGGLGRIQVLAFGRGFRGALPGLGEPAGEGRAEA